MESIGYGGGVSYSNVPSVTPVAFGFTPVALKFTPIYPRFSTSYGINEGTSYAMLHNFCACQVIF